MERDGHLSVAPGGTDRRARVVNATDSGRHVWEMLAQPKIRACYAQVLADFSVYDLAHALHDLLKIPQNMGAAGQRSRPVPWPGATCASSRVERAKGESSWRSAQNPKRLGE